MEKVVVEFEVKTDKATKPVDDVDKSIDKAKKSTDDFGDSLDLAKGKADELTGGLVSGFEGAVKGVGKAVTAMKTLRGAIISTGIGALLVAIVAIGTAFTASEDGQNKFSKALGVIGSIVGNVVDLLSDLGDLIISVVTNPQQAIKDFGNLLKENIVNRFMGMLELIPELGRAIGLLFEGEFAEAGKVAADAVAKVALGIEDITEKTGAASKAVAGFIGEVAREAELASKIADQRAKATKLERELLVERAAQEIKIADLQLKSRQRDLFSAKERAAFLVESQEIQDKLIAKEQQALELKRDATILENTLSKSTTEALDAEAQAIADVLRIQSNRLTQAKATQEELNAINAEARAQAKATNDERIAGIKAVEMALLDSNQLEIRAVNDKYDELRRLAEKYNQDTVALERKRQEELDIIRQTRLDKEQEDFFKRAGQLLDIENETRNNQEEGIDELIMAAQMANAQRLADDEKSAKARDALETASKNAKIGLASQANAIVAELGAESAGVAKATAVAGATINTYQAATNALANTPGPPPIPQIAAGLAVVAGLLQVRNILKVKTPGNKGGGGAGAVAGPSAPSVGQAISLVNPNSAIEGLGNQLGETLGKRPPKSFVVGGEVSSQQQLDREVVANGTFG